MAFSHDGQTLAIPTRQEIFLWRLNRRPRLQSLRLKGEGIRVVSVALSEYDNCVASGYQQGTVALWTTETRQPRITFRTSRRTDVYVTIGGKRGIILVTASGKTIQTWHLGELLAENDR